MKPTIIASLATLFLLLPQPPKPHPDGIITIRTPTVVSFQPLQSDLKPRGTLAEIVPVPAPIAEPTAPTPVSAPVSQCGDNQYANFIYVHESGCRLDAINPIGACGLGQSLPCSKMGCSLSDYACQNAWFSNYAVQRYGSWYNAYIYWVGHSNW